MLVRKYFYKKNTWKLDFHLIFLEINVGEPVLLFTIQRQQFDDDDSDGDNAANQDI